MRIQIKRPMPPKHETLENQIPQNYRRSSERLRQLKMPKTLDKSSPFSTPIDLCASASPPPEKKKRKKASITKKNKATPSKQEDVETPIRHHLVVTRGEDVKRFEELDDCFILGFDPIEPTGIKGFSAADKVVTGSPEIAILSEKGQVACRDYPHSRHLCIKFPFEKTAHEKYCELCYCYVCDIAAPCKSWSSSSNNPLLSHCNAYHGNDVWKQERTSRNPVTKEVA